MAIFSFSCKLQNEVTAEAEIEKSENSSVGFKLPEKFVRSLIDTSEQTAQSCILKVTITGDFENSPITQTWDITPETSTDTVFSMKNLPGEIELTVVVSILMGEEIYYQSDEAKITLVEGHNPLKVSLKKFYTESTLEVDLVLPTEKSNSSVTVTANFTSDGTVSNVVYKKGQITDTGNLLIDTDARSGIQDESDNSKWLIKIDATDESANGDYTMAALDSKGNIVTQQFTIDNFDFTPPSALDESIVTGTYEEATSDGTPARILLTWENPADEDFDHVEITYITNDRKNDSEPSAAVTESGQASENGSRAFTEIEIDKAYYTFTLLALDKVGNKSPEVTCKVWVNSYVTTQKVEISGSEEETWRCDSTVFIDGRSLSLPSFIICDHEVTRKEFKDIMGTDPSTTEAVGNADNNPVNYTNWYQAIAYCNKRSIKEGFDPCYTVSSVSDWENLAFDDIPMADNDDWNNTTCDFTKNGYRLPTEVEWEYSARGGESYIYSGSDDIDEVGWYAGNSDLKTHEVKQLKPNGYGLYDMTGNVWEWCWDFYGEITAETPVTGAETGTLRLRRGGSWYNVVRYCTLTISKENFSNPPYKPYSSYGFRVARTVVE